ncbi:MAG: ATP-binding protein [Methylophilus sp.]|nr:ATP-binding protein [Methylophilus sp.]
MGRLYWKFFLFFFLAQLTTGLGVGLYILFSISKQNASIDHSPIGHSLMHAAQTTLELSGVEATKDLLAKWEGQQLMHRVYVIDQAKQDLLQRKLEAQWLNSLDATINAGPSEDVARVTFADNQSYLIFAISNRGNRSRGWTPPPPNIEDGEPPPPPPHELDHANPLFKLVATFPIKGLIIGTLASILFAAILAWYFSKPIKTLRLAFEHAAEGNLNITVADKMGSRKDELSDLGRHFDYMASRLNTLMQGQTRLLHHVSHELRSPLARMHMALGLALQNPDRAENSLNRIELEANRMDKMIGELLELSRFESGMVALKIEPYSLSDVLETIVSDAAFEASSKRVHVVLKNTYTGYLQGQPDLIYRAIENVVRNAIKYAPNDSIVSIHCTLQAEGKLIDIEITDQGAGVLETELEDIFKPFVRGHSGSQVVGHGVGLAITKQVIETHGGKAVAKNLKPYGFSVTMTLPV